jgi:hypothetical protein
MGNQFPLAAYSFKGNDLQQKFQGTLRGSKERGGKKEGGRGGCKSMG